MQAAYGVKRKREVSDQLCACGCGEYTLIAWVTRTNRGHIKGQPMRTKFRHGRPKALKLRFWEKVNKEGPIIRPELGPCWLWTGGVGGALGYGRITDGDNVIQATHVAVYLETGKWPTDEVCHKCDTALCVRYPHFFEGTHKENCEDMAQKGRGGSSKLTVPQVLTMRYEYEQGVPQHTLVDKYDVTSGTVSRIVNGKRRPHI
jgi:hypothetical protein